MDQILHEVPKIQLYFDDIIVHGKSGAECMANLKLCLVQLYKYDLHLNVSKCTFFES